MSRYWSALVGSLDPYVPGEQPRIPGLVKLNTNENPFGPSPHVLAAIRAAATDGLRLYPDPRATRLREAIAAYHEVSPDEVFVGNGSDEVLAHAFAALLKQREPLRLPDVTYGFYAAYCRLFDIDHEPIPLDGRFRIDLDAYAGRSGPIVLANPNAPTGIALSHEAIRGLLRARRDAPVVIDEAYVDFGAETVVPLIREHPNLLVVRTTSKSRSLAGLRVGYALGYRALVEGLNRVKDSFNSYPLGALAQAGATASFADEDGFQRARVAILRNREHLVQVLDELGFETLPSCANFVFTRHPAHGGEGLVGALRARAVLVRHFRQPRIVDFLRISVGSDAEIARFGVALREALDDPATRRSSP